MFSLFSQLLYIYIILAKNSIFNDKNLPCNILFKALFIGQFLIAKNKVTKKLSIGEKLCKSLEELGPIYIKLGQFFATRPDIIGENTAKSLQKLQTNVTASNINKVIDFLKKQNLSALDITTLSQAIACASIAQVHKIKIKDHKDSDKNIVLKIVLPEKKNKILQQNKQILKIAKFLEKFKSLKRFQLLETIQILTNQLENECNLLIEASSCQEFANLCRKNKINLKCPTVFWQYCHENILALEWIEGKHLSKQVISELNNQQRKSTAQLLLQQFIITALFGGFFHADIHQGNIIINNKQVIFLDFGIMERLSWQTRFYLAEIISALFERNYKKAAQAHKMAGYILANTNLEHFAARLRYIFDDIYAKPISDLPTSLVLEKLFLTTREFGMQVQPKLIRLQKTMLTIEGLLKQLDPTFDYLNTTLPIVKKFLRTEPPKIIAKNICQIVPELLPKLIDNKDNLMELLHILCHKKTLTTLKSFTNSNLNQKNQSFSKLFFMIAISIIIILLAFNVWLMI